VRRGPDNSEGASIATAVYRTFENVSGLYDGWSDPLEIFHDILPQVYDFGQLWDYSGLFCTLAHEKPNLKILEIGAGTGGTTAKILEYLVSENRERMYFSYTYTDISSGFFVAARERFSDAQAIEYAVLDISHDPLDQGFEEHSYDLVIASNVSGGTQSPPFWYAKLQNR
jgi:SAM-dependent methyltransferase